MIWIRIVLILGWVGYFSGHSYANSPLFHSDPPSKGSALGGSLLPTGDVVLSCGAGYPEAFCQFDFAQSKSFNVALKASFQYAHGVDLFGINVFVSAPFRIGLVQGSRLEVALKLEPGAYLGGVYLDSFFLGFLWKTGVLFTYHLHKDWMIHFGMDVPFWLSLEPKATLGVGVQFSIDLLAGFEYRVDKHLGFFTQLGVGPMFYFGNLASRQNPQKTFLPSASIIALFGVLYRR